MAPHSQKNAEDRSVGSDIKAICGLQKRKEEKCDADMTKRARASA